MSSKVLVVAAPLVARTGVYRSATELVTEARRLGLEWSLYLGVSSRAAGHGQQRASWLIEEEIDPEGLKGVFRLSRRLAALPVYREADTVISLVPQSDMAIQALRARPQHVAYLRGLPWPARGESAATRAVAWRSLERLALSRVDEVWSTTDVLAKDTALNRQVTLVPPGLAPIARSWDGRGSRDTLIWAARYNHDKNPQLFLDLMRRVPLKGIMYGVGPLEDVLRASAPPNVTIAGWASPQSLWKDALAYVGTSHREAFGRSAVEAAMAGIPLLLANTFGAAPLLITTEPYLSRFCLPPEPIDAWVRAASALYSDAPERVRYSDYVWSAAQSLTITSSVRKIAEALDRLELRIPEMRLGKLHVMRKGRGARWK